MSTITYAFATTPTQFQTARTLILHYAQWLNLDLTFQDFDHELAHLTTEYAAPTGAMLLAYVDGQPAGVVGVHQFDDRIGEMKRLFVDTPYRHLGIGHQLVSRILRQAAQLHYDSVRLDTLPTMIGPQKLYASLGFKPIAPYRYNPVADALFLEYTVPPEMA